MRSSETFWYHAENTYPPDFIERLFPDIYRKDKHDGSTSDFQRFRDLSLSPQSPVDYTNRRVQDDNESNYAFAAHVVNRGNIHVL